MKKKLVSVYKGREIAAYGFGQNHPFHNNRHDAFFEEFSRRPFFSAVQIDSPKSCSEKELALFHTPDYIELVKSKSLTGEGYLDRGDTPAYPGVFESASHVVGSTLDAADRIMEGAIERAFVPIAGLHHARRNGAAGFCVFNDCGVVLEYLRANYGLSRMAYIDIDAHHGDGVYYGFEEDPDIIFADIHETGRSLYPGTGYPSEKGKGAGEGKKLNIEMPAGAQDGEFFKAWEKVEAFIDDSQPEFILMQCGCDSLSGDPLTHLQYSEEAHQHAAARLKELAQKHCNGKMLAVGGGGYNMQNIKSAWTAVVSALL